MGDFQVRVEAPTSRKLVIEANLETLIELREAMRGGRRTRAQRGLLASFGQALEAADPAIEVAFELQGDGGGGE